MDIYRNHTPKTIEEFVTDFEKRTRKSGFVIHNRESMNMAQTFADHNIKVDDDFDIHMMQICKPEKAAQIMGANPERAALMPKFVIAFTAEGQTQVRFFHHAPQTVDRLLNDTSFSAAMVSSSDEIIRGIEDCL